MKNFRNNDGTKMALVMPHLNWGFVSLVCHTAESGGYRQTHQDFDSLDEAIEAAKKFVEES